MDETFDDESGSGVEVDLDPQTLSLNHRTYSTVYKSSFSLPLSTIALRIFSGRARSSGRPIEYFLSLFIKFQELRPLRKNFSSLESIKPNLNTIILFMIIWTPLINITNVQLIQIHKKMQAVRLQQKSPESPQPLQDDQLQLMTANLLKIKREITQRNEQTSSATRKIQAELEREGQGSHMQSKEMNATRTSQLCEQIRQKYNQYLSHTKLPTNHQQKLSHLLDQPQLSLGPAVALFQLLFYFRDVISTQILEQITEKAYHRLMEFGGKMGAAEKCCLLELIAICGVYCEEVVGFVVEEMLEGRLGVQLAFVVLSNMGFKGLELLVNLARQDFKETPIMILNYLSRSEQILKQLIIPTLVQDLSNSKAKGRQKDIILSILNRLNSSLSSNPTLFPLLSQLLQNSINDRGFIASVLRASGLQGQRILLQFMSLYPGNERVMLPIVSVLPWRVRPDVEIRVKVIQYTLGSNFMPGTLYQYQGNIQPSAFCYEEGQCCDSLCINARDFIAALNRLLSTKQQNFQHEEYIRKGPINNLKLFTLAQLLPASQSDQPTQITQQVIRALTKCLSNPKPQIREAAINSLGLIGLPQAFQAIDEIGRCLWDKDSRNRSMACWALSKICENPGKKVIGRLVELLRDSFWKVRISACICIGSIVQQPHEHVIQALIKCLKDNSINKVTICETLIKLRTIGQQILLQILKTASQNDFKLKQAIIYSLRESDVKSPHIDFVLEEIFKHCKGTRVETRVNCLETLNWLRVKAVEEGENIVYLKAKTILPFYYYFLEDPVLKIREMATQAIFSFGGQAELIFIQGIAKGSQMVRVESAKGLARLGIQNFRALILGLRDDDAQVRQTTTSVLLQNFTPEQVSQHYASKTQQVPSLLCNLKDILSGGGLSPNMKTFIKETILLLEKVKRSEEQGVRYSDLRHEVKSDFLFQDSRKK